MGVKVVDKSTHQRHDDDWWFIMSCSMDKEARKKLSALIKQVRGERSQRDFAKDLGVSYAAVQSWENCDSLPSLENMEILANSLLMPLPDFIRKIKDDGNNHQPTPTAAEDLMPFVKMLERKERAKLISLIAEDLA